MVEERLKPGRIAGCNNCDNHAVINTKVVEFFGYRIGLGPDGPSQPYVETPENEVLCNECIAEKLLIKTDERTTENRTDRRV